MGRLERTLVCLINKLFYIVQCDKKMCYKNPGFIF